MKSLTEYRNLAERAVCKARFCQDIGNVHGPRDTFREVVFFGPGLHICVTQLSERSNAAYPCDFHVDTFQQGNLVKCGHCIPNLDYATVAHVISVGPYLKSLAKSRAKKYLEEKGAKVPGL